MFMVATQILSLHICTDDDENNENDDENACVRTFAVPDLD